MSFTIITLSNGKKVGNFSSPHPFEFEDGSILPAVSPEEAERLKVDFIEEPIGNKGDVVLKFKLSRPVIQEMADWKKLYDDDKVDVVFCPLPMIEAIKQKEEQIVSNLFFLQRSPFRAIRMVDRVKKLVSIHKQCI